MLHPKHALAIASLAAASFLPIAAASDSMKTANDLFRAKKYAEAIAEYQKVLDVDPGHWAANYQTALSWMAQYHPQSADPADAQFKAEAVAHLEKLMTLAPPTPADMQKVENYYLSLLTSAGDNDRAVAFLEQKLGEEPNDLDRLAMLAQLQAQQGHFDQALRAYEQMARAQPEVKTNWYTVGVLCWERSNKALLRISPEERAEVIQQGLDALDRALALDPEYTEAIAYKNLLYREKADALSKAGKPEEAKAALDEALRLRDQAMELMQKKKAQGEAPPSDH